MTARLTAPVAGLLVLAEFPPGLPPPTPAIRLAPASRSVDCSAPTRCTFPWPPSGPVIPANGARQTGGERAAVTNYNAVADQ